MSDQFWKNIHIKIDKEVKESAKESDIQKLVHYIDQSNFIGYRDVTAILLMFKSGIRISTLCHLKASHIDFENHCLNLDGAAMKNHKYLKLPLDEELLGRLKVLITLNNNIRKHYRRTNNHIFIIQNCLNMDIGKSSNCAISKQLNKYSKRFNLPNINAHAIRRAYAKNLLDKGASIPLISKALGHSDLAVTTQYLDLGVDEVEKSLRGFL
ncbi:site-specific integrase [Lysinibacillus capsici]|uniref:site-specific integrase n=1 Tax=Lysinibacillus capsici TaxID=2115968 RepID=UPI0034E46E01